MKKSLNYVLVVLLSLLCVVIGISLHTKYPSPLILPISGVVAIVVLIVGIIMVHKDSNENFDMPPNMVLEIQSWLNKMAPNLTPSCKKCVVQNASKLWKQDTFKEVLAKSVMEQQNIIKGLLVLNCEKDCVIKPDGISIKDVDDWLKNFPELSQDCKDCVARTAVVNWDIAMFNSVKSKPVTDQQNIITALILLNCDKCKNGDSLDLNQVKKWMNGILQGQTVECSECVLNVISKMWNSNDFKKIKAMDLKSQTQILQTLIFMNCEKICVEIPTKLDPQKVMKFIESILVGTNVDCNTCLVDTIMKNWTPDSFNKVQKMSNADKIKILNGLISMNCLQVCTAPKPAPTPVPNTRISREQVVDWVDSVGVGENTNCKNCVVDSVMKVWDQNMLNNIRARSREDQIEVFKGLLATNCMSACTQNSDKLSRSQVSSWINSLITGLDNVCLNCVVDNVIANVKPEQYHELQSRNKVDQSKVLQGFISFDCVGKCTTDKRISRTEVEKWVKNTLKDVKIDCASCIVDGIVNSWSVNDLYEARKWNAEDQVKFLTTYGQYNCPEHCNVLPPAQGCFLN